LQPTDYVTEVHSDWDSVREAEWNGLLGLQESPTPFMSRAYLKAMHDTGCASVDTGWALRLVTLRQQGELMAACPVYLKNHSYGEYVFDWAWAQAYERHGLDYYPKAVIAVPFTPVPGSRLLARSDEWRHMLLVAALKEAQRHGVSSLHLLLGSEQDLASARQLGWMQRDGVQFHWQNTCVLDFEDLLSQLKQDKRKKIRQERRKVAEAGITYTWLQGPEISQGDWDFFYRCYAQTYAEHGNPPYLNREFFSRMAHEMPQQWVLIRAERLGRPIACSLLAVQRRGDQGGTAYGRYWGALERHDCLHFETCYYQPIEWCLRNGITRFEGGAQGEHKMSRALLPVSTSSAHWIAHKGFAQAIDDFLRRERSGVAHYMDELHERTPLRRS
jgi:predicted N-acyltransferase